MNDTAKMFLHAEAVPNNTNSSVVWGIRIWNEWASNRTTVVAGNAKIAQLTIPLLEMHPVDIVYWMGKFVLEVHKTDGS